MSHSSPIKDPEGWPTTWVTLLSRIRETQDVVAWKSFVDLYAPIIYRYCRDRELQHADAQNVVQEVFFRVSRAISNFEYDTLRGRFRGWLGLITHQQVLRYRQRLFKTSSPASDYAGGDLATSFEGEVEGAWIEAFNAHVYLSAVRVVRAEIDAESWLAFERVWDRRECPGKVAESLGRKPQWVYQLKHSILRRLRQEIDRITADSAVFFRT